MRRPEALLGGMTCPDSTLFRGFARHVINYALCLTTQPTARFMVFPSFATVNDCLLSATQLHLRKEGTTVNSRTLIYSASSYNHLWATC